MNINTSYSSAYSSNQNQQNLQSKKNIEDKGQTSIKSTNDMTTEYDRRKKILDEKYSKIHEQNKLYEDPYRHIADKYKNPYSPLFRSDLTKAERDAASTMEMSWLRTGKGGQYSFNDAVFRNESRYDPTQASVEKKAINRQKVNEQLQSLFSQNGITIPANTNLRFTIDPNNFNLTVSGLKDELLTTQLENILNTDNNARELFLHTMKSRTDDSSQFTPDKLEKFHLINQIKTVTGYNLKDLEVIDGKFVTENGTNIFDIYKEELLKNPYTARHASVAASHYGSQLYELAKNGFDSIPDLVLSIDYNNGSLQDLA